MDLSNTVVDSPMSTTTQNSNKINSELVTPSKIIIQMDVDSPFSHPTNNSSSHTRVATYHQISTQNLQNGSPMQISPAPLSARQLLLQQRNRSSPLGVQPNSRLSTVPIGQITDPVEKRPITLRLEEESQHFRHQNPQRLDEHLRSQKWQFDQEKVHLEQLNQKRNNQRREIELIEQKRRQDEQIRLRREREEMEERERLRIELKKKEEIEKAKLAVEQREWEIQQEENRRHIQQEKKWEEQQEQRRQEVEQHRRILEAQNAELALRIREENRISEERKNRDTRTKPNGDSETRRFSDRSGDESPTAISKEGRFKTSQILEIMHRNIVNALSGGSFEYNQNMRSKEKINSDSFVTRWMDYTAKYGLAYQLRDGSVGVYFNDSTSMILSSNNSNFEYLYYEGNKTGLTKESYTLTRFPPTLDKKVSLLMHFRKYMDDRLKSHEDDVDLTIKSKDLDFLAKYVRTKHGVVFRLSNQVFQLNLNDHTKLIIHPDAFTITYVDKQRNTFHHTLEEFVQDQYSTTEQHIKDIISRLKYVRDIIDTMIQKRRSAFAETNKMLSFGSSTPTVKMNKDPKFSLHIAAYSNDLEAISTFFASTDSKSTSVDLLLPWSTSQFSLAITDKVSQHIRSGSQATQASSTLRDTDTGDTSLNENLPKGQNTSSSFKDCEYSSETSIPEETDVYDALPLNLAVMKGNIDMVFLLIRLGANLKKKDGRGRTPLVCAIVGLLDTLTVNADNFLVMTDQSVVHVNIAKYILEVLKSKSKNGSDGSSDFVEVVDWPQKGPFLRGITPLCLAAYLGKEGMCKLLLDAGADPNAKDKNGATALMYGARDGHVEVVESLIERGADTKIVDLYGWSSSQYGQNYPDIVKIFENEIKKTDQKTKSSMGVHKGFNKSKGLKPQISKNSLKVDTSMLPKEHGVHSPSTPLIAPASSTGEFRNWSPVPRNDLIVNPVTISEENSLFKPTPMGSPTTSPVNHHTILSAIKSRDLNVFQTLVQTWSAAQLNSADFVSGINPLQYTCRVRPLTDPESETMLRTLLSQGANPNIRNPRSGKTPLHYLARDPINPIDTPTIVPKPFKSIKETTYEKSSHKPDLYAIEMKMMRILLQAGADPNSPDYDGNRPLHFAARLGNFEMVKLLVLEAGADVTVTNKRSKKPAEFCIDPVIRDYLMEIYRSKSKKIELTAKNNSNSKVIGITGTTKENVLFEEENESIENITSKQKDAVKKKSILLTVAAGQMARQQRSPLDNTRASLISQIYPNSTKNQDIDNEYENVSLTVTIGPDQDTTNTSDPSRTDDSSGNKSENISLIFSADDMTGSTDDSKKPSQIQPASTSESRIDPKLLESIVDKVLYTIIREKDKSSIVVEDSENQRTVKIEQNEELPHTSRTTRSLTGTLASAFSSMFHSTKSALKPITTLTDVERDNEESKEALIEIMSQTIKTMSSSLEDSQTRNEVLEKMICDRDSKIEQMEKKYCEDLKAMKEKISKLEFQSDESSKKTNTTKRQPINRTRSMKLRLGQLDLHLDILEANYKELSENLADTETIIAQLKKDSEKRPDKSRTAALKRISSETSRTSSTSSEKSSFNDLDIYYFESEFERQKIEIVNIEDEISQCMEKRFKILAESGSLDHRTSSNRNLKESPSGSVKLESRRESTISRGHKDEFIVLEDLLSQLQVIDMDGENFSENNEERFVNSGTILRRGSVVKYTHLDDELVDIDLDSTLLSRLLAAAKSRIRNLKAALGSVRIANVSLQKSLEESNRAVTLAFEKIKESERSKELIFSSKIFFDEMMVDVFSELKQLANAVIGSENVKTLTDNKEKKSESSSTMVDPDNLPLAEIAVKFLNDLAPSKKGGRRTAKVVVDVRSIENSGMKLSESLNDSETMVISSNILQLSPVFLPEFEKISEYEDEHLKSVYNHVMSVFKSLNWNLSQLQIVFKTFRTSLKEMREENHKFVKEIVKLRKSAVIKGFLSEVSDAEVFAADAVKESTIAALTVNKVNMMLRSGQIHQLSQEYSNKNTTFQETNLHSQVQTKECPNNQLQINQSISNSANPNENIPTEMIKIIPKSEIKEQDVESTDNAKALTEILQRLQSDKILRKKTEVEKNVSTTSRKPTITLQPLKDNSDYQINSQMEKDPPSKYDSNTLVYDKTLKSNSIGFGGAEKGTLRLSHNRTVSTLYPEVHLTTNSQKTTQEFELKQFDSNSQISRHSHQPLSQIEASDYLAMKRTRTVTKKEMPQFEILMDDKLWENATINEDLEIIDIPQYMKENKTECEDPALKAITHDTASQDDEAQTTTLAVKKTLSWKVPMHEEIDESAISKKTMSLKVNRTKNE
ncbi:Serine/threonine-protein kinase plk1, partial [Nowakowskiella sp. JEL0078]